MGWLADLFSLVLGHPVPPLAVPFLWVVGIECNIIVPAIARYVDNWEYGMERRNLPEAAAWGLACVGLPYVVFFGAVAVAVAGIATSPLWYPFYKVYETRQRELDSARRVRELERSTDPDRLEAEAEVGRLEQPSG